MSSTLTKSPRQFVRDSLRGLGRDPAQQTIANLENALRVAREIAASGDTSGMHVTTLRAEIRNAANYAAML